MILVLGWWSLVWLELSIYKSRIASSLGFLVCLRFCFPFSNYCIVPSFEGSVGRHIADHHEKNIISYYFKGEENDCIIFFQKKNCISINKKIPVFLNLWHSELYGTKLNLVCSFEILSTGGKWRSSLVSSMCVKC